MVNIGRREFFRKAGLGLAAIVGAGSLSGCGPSPDGEAVSYAKKYLETHKPEGWKELLSRYDWKDNEEFRDDLRAYYNPNYISEKDRAEIESMSAEKILKEAPYVKDGKLNDTHKATIGRAFKDWVEADFSF